MVQLANAYDVADLPQERTGFDPLPAGTYVSMVTDSKEKETSKGGKMVVLEHTIQEGEYAGRIVFENLNIVNANPKAEKIAFEALGELSHAIKLTGKLTNTEQLHNKRYQMVLEVEPAKEYEAVNPETGATETKMGKAQNRVKKFLPIGAAAPVTKAIKAADTADAPQEQPKGKTPPWKAKK